MIGQIVVVDAHIDMGLPYRVIPASIVKIIYPANAQADVGISHYNIAI
jgi:hypothetical protein